MPDSQVEQIFRSVLREIQQITSADSTTRLTPREQLIAINAVLLKLPIGEFAQIMGAAQNQVMPKGVPEGYAKAPGEA
jgi:hypothetical protein